MLCLAGAGMAGLAVSDAKRPMSAYIAIRVTPVEYSERNVSHGDHSEMGWPVVALLTPTLYW